MPKHDDTLAQLRQDFPQVEDVHIQVEYKRVGDNKNDPFSMGFARPYHSPVACTGQTSCSGGGYHITDTVRGMIEDGKVEERLTSFCHGSLPRKRGVKTRYQPALCMESVFIVVRITYRSDSDTEKHDNGNSNSAAAE